MRDETHDPAAESWVESAAAPDTHFPIQNLPLGLFRRAPGATPEAGVAIGDQVLPFAACGVADSIADLLAQEPATRVAMRQALYRLLRREASADVRSTLAGALLRQRDIELLVPLPIGDYTEFFGSIHHATNAAALMRPGAGLFPNYRHAPLAYHGRASSITVSGHPVTRPHGQRRARETGAAFTPTRRLDYEAELGFIVGTGNALGTRVTLSDAWGHIAGVCLLNDWSARDFQAWESDPLGPFLGKSFATSISPWIVTAEALAPFRVAPPARGTDAPPLLAYLSDETDRREGALNIEVDVLLSTAAMRAAGAATTRISRSTSATHYWTPAQLVTHHTANGCNLRTGDLLGSGTLSGPSRESWACLLELTRGGREPITLPNGETRAFLEDGDEVTLRGRAVAPGARSIGFGECRAVVIAAE